MIPFSRRAIGLRSRLSRPRRRTLWRPARPRVSSGWARRRAGGRARASVIPCHNACLWTCSTTCLRPRPRLETAIAMKYLCNDSLAATLRTCCQMPEKIPVRGWLGGSGLEGFPGRSRGSGGRRCARRRGAAPRTQGRLVSPTWSRTGSTDSEGRTRGGALGRHLRRRGRRRAGIVSKLRGLLAECGLEAGSILTSAFGCYRLDLPEGSRVDVLAASEDVREAEEALATGDLERSKEAAMRAATVARRPFLPGEHGAWVEGKRRARRCPRRRLGCLADACARAMPGAARWAEEAIALEPFRETGYRRLMLAHATAGGRAEALRVYDRCRRLVAEELGLSLTGDRIDLPRASPSTSAGEVWPHPRRRASQSSRGNRRGSASCHPFPPTRGRRVAIATGAAPPNGRCHRRVVGLGSESSRDSP